MQKFIAYDKKITQLEEQKGKIKYLLFSISSSSQNPLVLMAGLP